MTLSKAILPAIAAIFTVCGALAADPPAPPSGPGYGMGPAMRDHCRGVMRFLTHEERIMHTRETRAGKDFGNMTINQFRAWRNEECKKFRTMSAADKQKYAVKMQAKWDALPDSEKVKIYQKASKQRGAMGRGKGGRRHGGPGNGRGW